jgi:hypothetical protein
LQRVLLFVVSPRAAVFVLITVLLLEFVQPFLVEQVVSGGAVVLFVVGKRFQSKIYCERFK